MLLNRCWPRIGRVAASKVTDTNWIWALHADCHDFRAHDTRIAALTSRVFASHFGHLSLIFAWIGGLFIAGARFSNYVAWLDRPAVYRPGAQPVPRTVPGFPSIVQDVVNGDLGGGFASIQITSGLFFIWRSHGFTTSSQLFMLRRSVSVRGIRILEPVCCRHRNGFSALTCRTKGAIPVFPTRLPTSRASFNCIAPLLPQSLAGR